MMEEANDGWWNCLERERENQRGYCWLVDVSPILFYVWNCHSHTFTLYRVSVQFLHFKKQTSYHIVSRKRNTLRTRLDIRKPYNKIMSCMHVFLCDRYLVVYEKNQKHLFGKEIFVWNTDNHMHKYKFTSVCASGKTMITILFPIRVYIRPMLCIKLHMKFY